MPAHYDDAFICQALGLSYTELEKQPYEWVQSSLEYLQQKFNYENAQRKVAEGRSQRK